MKLRPLLFPLLLAIFTFTATSAFAQDAPTATVAAETPGAAATEDAKLIEPRETLAPPVPGIIEQQVVRVVDSTGLADESFLGLTSAEWINLGISLAIVLVGYLLGFWIIQWVVNWIARRVNLTISQDARGAFVTSFRWLIMMGALYLATYRLTFLRPNIRQALLDIYLIVTTVFLAIFLWHIIDLIGAFYRHRIVEREQTDMEPVIVFAIRAARILMLAGLTAWLLTHFGVNVTALAAAVGLGGLAISLAARDTIADVIAGIIILIDRPFRVGDRIEVEKANTWGDVTDIGLRTTRIRTRDNRLVIVPNSMIASNEIINYTYPDPRYRIQTRVGIAYGSDIEQVRQIMIDTVRSVDGILPDLPVDALFDEMGDSAMIFVVRWWIDSYEDFRRALDKVNTALQKALDQHGVICPYPTSTVILRDETSAGGQSANKIAS